MEENGGFYNMSASHIVPPSQIQKGLDALWNSEENKDKVKASLFNVIFFTTKSVREEYLRKVAFKLIEKFPARIFFISSNSSSQENSIKTAVSVMTTEQGEYNITCDVIEISAQGKEERQIPFVLLPHIIPDLPVFLVWAEDPTSSSFLCEDLKGFATRIIFDSESAKDLCQFAKAISEIQTSSRCEIADLNWARLESWRDIVSSTFSKADKIEHLQNASSIVIKYNAQETPFFCHTKIQAIYLQGWLATRMGWTPDEKHFALDLSRFLYSYNGNSIDVQLQGIKNEALPPGMVLSLEVQCKDDKHYLFSRDLQALHKISCIYSTKDQCDLPVHFITSKGESGQSLIKEIFHKGTSQHYQELLQMISHWSRAVL